MPLVSIAKGVLTGWLSIWPPLRATGVDHVFFNLRHSERPAAEVIEEIAAGGRSKIRDRRSMPSVSGAGQARED